MAGMKSEHCVEIRVPLENAKAEFGSGYTLAPNWVLTARHVVYPKNRDDSKPIEIAWRDETGEGYKKKEKITRDKIVWCNKDHDIALISCESPYNNLTSVWSLVSRDIPDPASSAQFEGGGYLSGLPDESGNPGHEPITGILLPRFSMGPIAGLKVDGGLDNDDLWKGFSGSPIFLGNKLVAVAVIVNPGKRGKRLGASLLGPAMDAIDASNGIRLRDVDGFFERPADTFWSKGLRPEIIKMLQAQPAVFAALKKSWKTDIDTPFGNSDEAKLADGLHDAPKDSVIKWFFTELHFMRKQKSTNGVRVIQYLARVWLILLVEDNDEVPDIIEYKENPRTKPIPVNAVQPDRLVVEGIAAKSDQRNVELHLRGDRLKSVFDMTPENYTGIDDTYGQFAKDAKDQVRWKHQPGPYAFSADDIEKELEMFATRPATGVTSLSEYSDGERRKLIDAVLEDSYPEKGGTSYIRIPGLDRIPQDSPLRDFHRRYLHLLVYSVSMQSDVGRTSLLSRLHKIIYHAQEYLADKNNPQDDWP